MTPTFRGEGFLSPTMAGLSELENPAKVVEIRKVLAAILRTVNPRVYYESAPEGAAYPYLVYNLPNSIDRGSMEVFVLDVDAWDVPEHNDTVAIEILMDIVDRTLHKRVVNADGLPLVIYRDRRFPVSDDDKRIVRRKAVYEVRVFERRRDYHGR